VVSSVHNKLQDLKAPFSHRMTLNWINFCGSCIKIAA